MFVLLPFPDFVLYTYMWKFSYSSVLQNFFLKGKSLGRSEIHAYRERERNCLCQGNVHIPIYQIVLISIGAHTSMERSTCIPKIQSQQIKYYCRLTYNLPLTTVVYSSDIIIMYIKRQQKLSILQSTMSTLMCKFS